MVDLDGESLLDSAMNPTLILTPLALEHVALSAALNLQADGRFHLAVGGHGKVQFALSTQLLIQRLKPELVICAGGAGSLSPTLKPLDVVVAETTVEHDFNLHFISRPLPQFAAHQPTLEKIKRRFEAGAFRLHFGALASGDEDIVDSARAAEIAKKTGAVAVAWEGAGGARACRLHNVPFLEIRAITDNADSATPESFHENLKSAMANVAEILRLLF